MNIRYEAIVVGIGAMGSAALYHWRSAGKNALASNASIFRMTVAGLMGSRE
jgi:hypothetical protein